MTGLLVALGELRMLELITNKLATTENLRLKLFKNDITPANGDLVAAYTEADFAGYSDIELLGANWVASGAGPSQLQYPQQSFIANADQTAQTIYGAYTIRATEGILVHTERFATPAVVQSNGDTVKVTPILTQT